MTQYITGDQAAGGAAQSRENHQQPRHGRVPVSGEVATAFGQLKIAGKILPEIRMDGLAAIGCQIRLNHIARKAHPDWKHADENLARLAKMRDVPEAV